MVEAAYQRAPMGVGKENSANAIEQNMQRYTPGWTVTMDT
jgi:hypothetical protein